MIDKPEVIIPAGDSQCVIASLELFTSKFKPFLMNRIAEIKFNLSKIIFMMAIIKTSAFFKISKFLKSPDLMSCCAFDT